MKERELRTAKKFGILDKCKSLEKIFYKLIELKR